MAILQKLETSYLAILRFVVIVISGLLLVATLILLVAAMVDLRERPHTAHLPKVTPDEIVVNLTKTRAQPNVQANKPAVQATQILEEPSRTEYERAANIIVSFVSKYGRGEEVQKDDVIDGLMLHVEIQPTPELMKAAASDLSDIFEKALSDKKVIELVSRPTWSSSDVLPYDSAAVGRSPLWVMNAILAQHYKMFKERIKQAAEDEETERAAEALRKEQAMQNLYIAAATFGAFLMLALLSIIVRVERNLRPLAHLADKPRATE